MYVHVPYYLLYQCVFLFILTDMRFVQGVSIEIVLMAMVLICLPIQMQIHRMMMNDRVACPLRVLPGTGLRMAVEVEVMNSL